MIGIIRLTKRSVSAVVAANALGLFTAMPAGASDSISVAVTANVVGVCKFFGSDYTMNIANSGSDIDPAAAGPAQGSVDITYRCSNGTNPAFTIGGAAITGKTVALTDGGSGSMTATLTGPASPAAGSGMGSSNDKTLTIQAAIQKTGAGGYENAPIGSYTGNFTVDVNP